MRNPRPARRFSYFDAWRDEELRCACGWKGPLGSDQVELYETLLEFRCPDCNTALAIVMYPTDDQWLERLEELTKPQRVEVLKRQRFLDDWHRLALRSPDQLPDLVGDELELVWDFITKDKRRYTVIRYAGTVIWRERAVFEGAARFEEVATMLKEKYGSRLRDLTPTPASEVYLYGDQLTAPEKVERVRKRLSSEP